MPRVRQHSTNTTKVTEVLASFREIQTWLAEPRWKRLDVSLTFLTSNLGPSCFFFFPAGADEASTGVSTSISAILVGFAGAFDKEER